MAPESLLGYVRASPFKPFRIVLNSGRNYDVHHPEFIDVGFDDAVYFYKKSPDSPHERWETFSLSLVEHIEHIQPTAAASPPA